jgi:hypothetical protein
MKILAVHGDESVGAARTLTKRGQTEKQEIRKVAWQFLNYSCLTDSV